MEARLANSIDLAAISNRTRLGRDCHSVSNRLYQILKLGSPFEGARRILIAT